MSPDAALFTAPFPILYVADVERSASFYCDLFGFTRGYAWPPEGKPEYLFLRLEPLGIGLAARPTMERLHRRELTPGAEFELCLGAADVDQAAAALRRNGARELAPPTDMPWGERLAYFADPDGTRIHIFGPLRPEDDR